MLVVVYAAKWLVGWDNKNLNAVLFWLTFVPLLVVFSRDNLLRGAIERKLRCRSCHKTIRGFEVMKVRDTRRCPHCSVPDPFAAAVN